MNTTFTGLGISQPFITALEKQGITAPTPIQVAAIPALTSHQACYLRAATGTGKTLAYLLPLIQLIDVSSPNVQLVVTAPTHELAIQIHKQCTDLSQLSGIPLRAVLLIGGTPIDRQIDKLKKKPHIVVGSPGRIHELIFEKKLKVHFVKAVVVDEADKTLVSKAFESLQAIVKATLKERRLIFVSATEEEECAEPLALLAPNITRIGAEADSRPTTIQHMYLVCEEREKADFVRKLIHAMKAERSIVFVHKNDTAELVARKLAHHKLEVADIHGELHKEERKKAMMAIRTGKAKVLIASDVAARGLDIKGVSHVFNLDAPTESDAYLHRAGRTGRAGASGVCVSLLSGQQQRVVKRYQDELGISLQRIAVREGQVFNFEDCS